jgi:5-methylthioadenosine/S-adenosylhomocysteine deaminase
MRRVPIADTRLDAEWIIPVEPEGVVLEKHSLIISEGLIAAILPSADADHLIQTRERYRLPGQALIPGLVNLHTHAAMTLLRGYADDLPLMTWLQEHIWPAEGRWMSPEFVYDGTRLACVEMLRGGITCFNDMYFFPEAAVDAATAAKQRIAAGIIVVDFPTPYAADPDGYLQKGLELRDAVRHHPLVSFCLAPHAPYSNSDKTLEKVVTYAAQLDMATHMHVHETHDEIEQGIEADKVRPLERLLRLGLLSPQFIAVHAVHLLAEEIDLLAECGCHVAHCPSSNLKLANGAAPVTSMLDGGINLGLGTDGAASNNRLDLWEEMRLAALLAKGTSTSASALPAHTALRMATLNGARALGLEAGIGSLTVGKQADIVAVDLSGPNTQPCYDPISQLVYSAGRQEVRHVWVAGKRVVENGHCTSLDEAEVLHRAQLWRERLQPHQTARPVR